jgi:hypothetical protein
LGVKGRNAAKRQAAGGFRKSRRDCLGSQGGISGAILGAISDAISDAILAKGLPCRSLVSKL